MKIGARRDYLETVKKRYNQSSKKQKGLILNKFCQNYKYFNSFDSVAYT